ncbi:sarcosine oxidase subunit gamma [Pannonibacter phragmitetus]|uniref:sarcosine oxidase subunit gamma n=1 Tax=Pannonibacter phragmitetus TaxID=121719 RepID=UPI000F45B997|nr:sarcosine oxidase subunit gamma family protein [Pannonibacter phragmitetus]
MTIQRHDFTNGPFALEELGSSPRFSLRVKQENRAALAEALGLELPDRVSHKSVAGGTEVLCTGPDEWVILMPEAGRQALIAAGVEAYARIPHSLVEISDREITLRLCGPQALTALTAACPRDVDALPVGRAARTLFDSATVILWRDGPDSFRMDVWRSFLPHVRAILAKVSAELKAGL